MNYLSKFCFRELREKGTRAKTKTTQRNKEILAKNKVTNKKAGRDNVCLFFALFYASHFYEKQELFNALCIQYFHIRLQALVTFEHIF